MKFVFALVVLAVALAGAAGQQQESQRCICPRIYQPVCGTNGMTYGNECELRCAGATQAYRGKCRGNSNGCICTQQFDPVCGVNGMTYGNDCERRCAGVALRYRGPCRRRN